MDPPVLGEIGDTLGEVFGERSVFFFRSFHFESILTRAERVSLETAATPSDVRVGGDKHIGMIDLTSSSRVHV